jgi:hypothetical protein
VICHESPNRIVGDMVLSSGEAVGTAESTMADVELLQVAAQQNTRSDKSRKDLENMESGRYAFGLLDSLKGPSVIYTQELEHGNRPNPYREHKGLVAWLLGRNV